MQTCFQQGQFHNFPETASADVRMLSRECCRHKRRDLWRWRCLPSTSLTHPNLRRQLSSTSQTPSMTAAPQVVLLSPMHNLPGHSTAVMQLCARMAQRVHHWYEDSTMMCPVPRHACRLDSKAEAAGLPEADNSSRLQRSSNVGFCALVP